MKKCLLIKTKDNRKFLTEEKNLSSLVEFAKTFNAELYSVFRSDDMEILSLKELTSAICNSKSAQDFNYKVAKKIYPKNKRSSIVTEAEKIRSFIYDEFLKGSTICLKNIKEKYKHLNLTDACLCNHISIVRKTLTIEGKKLSKSGAGNYTIV